jgi:serine/threonine protein phosphatase 1
LTFHVFTSAWVAAPKTLPPETDVLAVGDVHGCLRHLRAMVAHVKSVIRPDRRTVLVTLGDYIDRGPESVATLAFLRELDMPRVQIVNLIGNHDLYLRLLVGEEPLDIGFVERWLGVGGTTSLAELGFEREALSKLPLPTLRAQIRERLGADLCGFLSRLVALHRVADYLFVHAGLDPALPVDAQDLSDLVTIRQPFLAGAGWRHDVAVVHGHTIRGHEVLPHRISVDTGAYRTGVLSCLQLAGSRLRWMAVTQSSVLDALELLPSAQKSPLVYERS